MSEFDRRLFALEVVDCVGNDRAPSIQELYSLADRIGRDAGLRPMFDWSNEPPDLVDRVFLLRAAHLALHGSV
jgi:hypothetical protein